MMQNRSHTHTQDNGQLPGTERACHRRELSPSSSLFICLIFAALACGSCQTPLPALPYPTGPRTTVRLAPGDTIKVAYADESVPDQTQKIRRDGKVTLPSIGEITAAGKSVMALQREIIRLNEDNLENSDVVVTLESGMVGVIVSGFASKPGKYLFDRPTTVYQAIMEAGGVSDYGSASNIHLTRIINGEQRTETINLRPAIRGQLVKPEYVQDGDVIYIGRSLF
jgi:protein involved in polysaccharide export with SLBB domain